MVREAAPLDHVAVRWRHEVQVQVRDLTLVHRRHEQVHSAFALVGSVRAEVDHGSKEGVVEDAARVGRVFDDPCAAAQVEPGQRVELICIGGEKQGMRVDWALEHTDRVVLGHTRATQPSVHRDGRRAGQHGEERVHPSDEVQVVVKALRGGVRRDSVHEVERPNSCFDALGRLQRARQLRPHGGWLLEASHVGAVGDQLDVPGAPATVEPGLLGSVETQDREPARTPRRLDPIGSLVSLPRRRGTE